MTSAVEVTAVVVGAEAEATLETKTTADPDVVADAAVDDAAESVLLATTAAEEEAEAVAEAEADDELLLLGLPQT
jgi:hypothetical protein